MLLSTRPCGIHMHLEKCKICGQQGYLEFPGVRLHFRTTDGLGQFYGQLIHVMAGMIGISHTHCDGHIPCYYQDKGNRRLIVGRINWDYMGTFTKWTLVQNITNSASWYEDFSVLLDVNDHSVTTAKHQTFILPFRDLCYAVTKCGTEILKEYGIFGYTNLAEHFEDLNIREFLELKAFALHAEEVMGYKSLNLHKSSLENEIALLLFDM